jgi:glycogen debranching enzyme
MNKKELIKKLSLEIEKLKDKRGYIQAGSPRFKGLFGRDSLIVAWQLLKYNPVIAEKTISILASLQGKKENIETGEEPGKILHEYYPEDTPDLWWEKNKQGIKWLKRGVPVYMSVDSTPLFLIVLGMYLETTNNFGFAEKIKQEIKLGVDWMINYGDKDNDLFLKYEKKSSEGLFHQAWKDSDMKELSIVPPVSMVEVQGYQYLSLKYASMIMKKLGDVNFSKKCLQRSVLLKKKFNNIFWDQEKKYFILALNKDKEKISKITSNPGHLLFTDIISKEKSEKIVNRLFEKEMWTPYGIRTYSMEEPEFNYLSYHMGTVWPHDNWIIAQGLKKLGYINEYNKIKKALISANKKLGFIPELYGVNDKKEIKKYRNACYLQAWASGSILSFLID